MIGEKCEYCGDKALILKKVEGKNLCLDCYCEFKNKNMTHPKNNQYYDDSWLDFRWHTTSVTDGRYTEYFQLWFSEGDCSVIGTP